MWMLPGASSKAELERTMKKMPKRMGARTQLCLNPLLVSKLSDIMPRNCTLSCLHGSRKWIWANSWQSVSCSILYRLGLLTVPSAFARLKNDMHTDLSCSLDFSRNCRRVKILSVVERPALNPLCVKRWTRSASLCNRFKMTHVKTLRAFTMKEIRLNCCSLICHLYSYRVLLSSRPTRHGEL